MHSENGRTKGTSNTMHPYYTPKSLKIQGLLVIFNFFVNYDNYLCQHSYVN